jgi:uncharacterized protein
MVDVQKAAVVAILTRAPSSGGKTRLFSALGCPPDPDLLTALFLDTFDAACVTGVMRVVCYEPASAGPEIRALVGDEVPLLAQRGDDLGERMRNAFEDLLGSGAATVVLIGSDLPLLDSGAIAEAHAVLRSRPETVVLGPATDGGYYLIGATRVPQALFGGIRWGTNSVLQETETKAHDAGVEVHRVAEMSDVDTPYELRRVAASSGPRGQRTRHVIARLGLH